MKMPIADVADRYTILLIKVVKHIEPATILDGFQAELTSVDYKKLSKINSRMWELEDAITAACGMAEIGALYLELRELTKQRVEEKNRIAAEHGGPMERKNY